MKNFIRRFRVFTSVLTLTVFLFQSIGITPAMASELIMPVPGTMVSLSAQPFTPSLLEGLQINPTNPLQLDFIVSKGEDTPDDAAFNAETTKMVKYFLAALTVPEKDLWVNLSPFEKDRIMPDAFAQTDMGRDLLAEDYILKQLSSSLMHPDLATGKAFWQDVYAKAVETTGSSEVPTDVFHKIWIMPKDILVYENEKGALIVKSSLEVRLEEDLVAAGQLTAEQASSVETGHAPSQTATEAIRRAIVPVVEKEVNTGKHFAALRKIYHAVALAQWYKMRLKDSVIGKLYADQNKTPGIDTNDPAARERVYQQYLEAFRKGVFNFIKEEPSYNEGRKTQDEGREREDVSSDVPRPSSLVPRPSSLV